MLLISVSLSHTRAHLYKSALEAVGYAIAQHVDILEERGVVLKNITAVGGGVKNGIWMQIISDILGKPVQIPSVTVGASYGDALMAALAVGHFRDFEHLHQAIHIRETILPNPDIHRCYQPMKELYDKLYQANKELMHQI